MDEGEGMTDYAETLERAIKRYGADSPEVRRLIEQHAREEDTE